jgi:shikimate dehydrogenase
MHNAAFRAMEMNSIYVAVDVPEKSLAEVMDGIRALKVSGFNVTVPHKIAVMKLLDRLDESAAAVQAVNTVANRGGKLIGYNTDGEGALQALQSKIKSVRGKKVVILGAGGAARAIAFTLTKAGADVTIANRTPSKAKAISSIIQKKLGKKISVIPLKKTVLKKAIEGADVLVNATSIGMTPKANETLVTSDMLHRGLVVNDIVYKPIRTKLLKEAEKVGAKTIDGLGMLVNQAAISFKIWTGRPAPARLMTAAAEKAFGGSK